MTTRDDPWRFVTMIVRGGFVVMQCIVGHACRWSSNFVAVAVAPCAWSGGLMVVAEGGWGPPGEPMIVVEGG